MSISASLPRGRDGGEEPPPSRQSIRKDHKRVFTVLYDPSGTFRPKIASFTHQEVVNKTWGMVVYGVFQNGTIIEGHDQALYVIYNRKMYRMSPL